MNKFEKLIEYIINDEDSKARELFHQIVVEKSRDIYESIMDEEQVEEMVHGAEVDDLVDEVSCEEETFEDDKEGEDEFPVTGEEDFGGEEEVAGDDFDGEEAGEEDQLLNIDAKLDELLAKFDEIMGDDVAAGDEEIAADDEFGGEEEVAGDDFGGEEEVAGEEQFAEGKNPFAKSGQSGKSGSAKSGQSGKSGSAKSGQSGKSASELMREYVEKVGDIYGGQGDATEGDAVGGAGKKVSVNDKSITGPGADFGGNVVKRTGADNANPDGTSAPSSEKPKVDNAGNVNVPGGKAAQKSAPKADGAEGNNVGAKDTMGKSVNDKSVQKQNTGVKR